ncbi:MAG: HAD family phosphatase [Acidimicrobiia bacterium]|nr:HAD family phosphatase [Acidimicrobiia bacterium]
MPRAVVFDCDGVLVDSEPHSAVAWVAALGRYGHRATAADVAACTGLGYAAAYAHLAAVDPEVTLPSPEDLAPEVLAALGASFDRGLRVFPDAADCVTALAFDGTPLGVASSSRRDRLDLTLERSGLGRYFTATVAGDEVPQGKPAPDVYLAAAARLGVRPGDCLAVEDTGHGAAAAVAAGMRVIGVARLPAEVGRLLGAGAALVDRLDPTVLRELL